ncbi:MAG TPA: SDR family oxidoreductase [Solirubrobacteraceae bacterium]|jgi:3-oxoacyl-[acyl-carrier protein] reductase|nr:SDR family oxidoreductase [Solirubrobacteraceae bacterium]
MTADSFTGRVALVTGAGRGIGRAIALGLADAGGRVALISRTEVELAAVAAEIRSQGGTASTIVADVGDPEQASQVMDRVTTELGPVEILVNNAAVVWPLGLSATIDPGDWQQATQINVIGPVTLSLAALPRMIERGWGRIANVSSGVAANPTAMIGGNAYTATKAALEAHTLNLAAELDNTGVTANVFRPGAVDTAMQGWIREQDPERIGTALHARFVATQQSGTLLTPQRSAGVLLDHLAADGNGEIWNVS